MNEYISIFNTKIHVIRILLCIIDTQHITKHMLVWQVWWQQQSCGGGVPCTQHSQLDLMVMAMVMVILLVMAS